MTYPLPGATGGAMAAPTSRPAALTYPIDWSALPPLPIERLLAVGGRGMNQSPESAMSALPQAARAALGHWNSFMVDGAHAERDAFLASARVIWQSAMEAPGGAAAWPLPIGPARRPRLSASMQGLAISVLVRAHALTGDTQLLRLARLAAQTVERDIFDGGVSAPLARLGELPQDVASYPANHGLAGILLVLLGLRDLAMMDATAAPLRDRITGVFQKALPVYDMGHGIRDSLTSWDYADAPAHRLGVALLRGLGEATGDEVYLATAMRWARYLRASPALGRRLADMRAGAGRAAWAVASALTRKGASGRAAPPPENVLVIAPAFPVAGGTRSVVAGVVLAMAGRWQLRYLTRHVGANPNNLDITRFGNALTTAWQFPFVWLYVASAFRTFKRLLRARPTRVLLPQDALYSGLAASLAGRLLRVRVAAMDHGTLTLPDSARYRSERRAAMRRASFPARIFSAILFPFYWPSMRTMARWTVRMADHFLVAGDEVQNEFGSYRNFPLGRITRYPYMVDSDFFHPLSGDEIALRRAEAGIPADAILVCMNNRLAPEKGMDTAIAAFRRALEMTPEPVRSRVRFVIGGGGPLRGQIEEDLKRAGLDGICKLWGEATVPEVATILGMSDIFVYASIRGTNVSVALLEAMASGCAIVGTTSPISHAYILSEGRGTPVAPDDMEALARAIAQYLVNPALARMAGEQARDYARRHHSAAALRRSMLRATGWEPEEAAAASSDTRAEITR